MRVLISHFYNEEYLLPWWLKHHREHFDHGVLIDYHSTDSSVEICRALVPEWEVVPSQNERFSAVMCDFEVMKHEERFRDSWKLVLNTTEFLVGDQLNNVIRFLEDSGRIGGRIPGAIMVDTEPEVIPDPDVPLVTQKSKGVWESDLPFERLAMDWYPHASRTRTLHRYPVGAYQPGRHVSNLPGLLNVRQSFLAIWWYAFSPWNNQVLDRKLQIQSKMDRFDAKFGFGRQHVVERSELDRRHHLLSELAIQL